MQFHEETQITFTSLWQSNDSLMLIAFHKNNIVFYRFVKGILCFSSTSKNTCFNCRCASKGSLWLCVDLSMKSSDSRWKPFDSLLKVSQCIASTTNMSLTCITNVCVFAMRKGRVVHDPITSPMGAGDASGAPPELKNDDAFIESLKSLFRNQCKSKVFP